MPAPSSDVTAKPSDPDPPPDNSEMDYTEQSLKRKQEQVNGC